MKRLIYSSYDSYDASDGSSSSAYTELTKARQMIDSVIMTKGRKEALYAIDEWNIYPEDVKMFIRYMKFNGPKRVKSVSYDRSHKAQKTLLLLEYEDGSKRVYRFDKEISTYDGSPYYTCSYLFSLK